MDTSHPLSVEEFWMIYKRVPRLTVEIVIRRNGETYLTLRDIEPCKGLWHLPGGTVRFGERLVEAVQRVAERELGVAVDGLELKGYIEYPSHYLHGLDCPVGIAFEVKSYRGTIAVNQEASRGEWFKQLPENMHEEQRDFLGTI
jgi:8-oxo-dGTP diphosphatase